MTELPDDFFAPVHRSLTQPLLLAGVPRRMAILTGTLTAALVHGTHNPIALVLGCAIHALGILAAQVDPQYFEVLVRHMRHKRHYYA